MNYCRASSKLHRAVLRFMPKVLATAPALTAAAALGTPSNPCKSPNAVACFAAV